MGPVRAPSAATTTTSTAGFEEWRIRNLPVVNVSKTATPTFDRTYDWTVEKTAVDPETLNLFNGQSGDVTWSVTPTP